ncbi:MULTISPECIES: RNA polymerase sigma-70 factor [Flavobacterium]|uniref:RNA polymerase sigma-70 factor n=1 Tax=Flavobacterium cupriresistens TaxID=2893885 RepID=A0ABU4RDA9_9FLAO|nr:MULTISPECIES: RNA polymerase sigma-70 factor [unclassified Flavobacterium]MDX6190549.1 RNA polymerase sigma-70 factor [Flavobacterium sp. Fl-318]UFH43609.1 RNA polymerase sigma-70 factor [Flavobacterium sp. F-323]
MFVDIFNFMKEEYLNINAKNFPELYDQYWNELFCFSRHHTGDEEAAKEIVQQIFISIWERREKLQIQTSIRAYLYGATKLKILEYHRKQATKKEYESAHLTENNTVSNNTEEHMLHKDLLRELQAAINGLPERCRQVYLMSREEGMDNRSIAASLVITEKAVEGNITRALRHIRDHLKIFRSSLIFFTTLCRVSEDLCNYIII